MGRFAVAVDAVWAIQIGARTKAIKAKSSVLRMDFSCSRGNNISFGAKNKFTPLAAQQGRGFWFCIRA
jgi:hypothetical protein